VPADQAQSVADALVAGGVRGIWNFTPVQIAVPPEVIIKREDLAASLAVLSHRLRRGDKGR
jgi:redox-sensing transcriptional repressor